jgi:hypothetical protein
MTSPHTTVHTLNDVARRLAPHLRIISASQPAPTLRTHNVVALADSPELGRHAVLTLEGIEHRDDQLGTVVMSSTEPTDDTPGADPEGVTRHVFPRIVAGGLIGGVVGACVIAAGAALLGARGWEVVGAALAGFMLISVFGAIWVTFAGLGGSDAYRQTFVDDSVRHLTLVSVHTDDPDEAAKARDKLQKAKLRVLDVDRFGQIGSPTIHPS